MRRARSTGRRHQQHSKRAQKKPDDCENGRVLRHVEPIAATSARQPWAQYQTNNATDNIEHMRLTCALGGEGRDFA